MLYNIVGFQTKMRVREQQRVFRTLPGLSKAVFARYGSVHRNTYVDAPRQLDARLRLRCAPHLRLAGQMAGVEGYVESAALGLLAGIFAAFEARGEEPALPPASTAFGALLQHLNRADAKRFQPMNVNFGLFPGLADLPRKMRKPEKYERLVARALTDLAPWLAGTERLAA